MHNCKLIKFTDTFIIVPLFQSFDLIPLLTISFKTTFSHSLTQFYFSPIPLPFSFSFPQWRNVATLLPRPQIPGYQSLYHLAAASELIGESANLDTSSSTFTPSKCVARNKASLFYPPPIHNDPLPQPTNPPTLSLSPPPLLSLC